MSRERSDHKQAYDRILESLLKISQETHNAESISDFVATVHSILSELILARNFFIALYEEKSGLYFFPYHVDEYDNIETHAVFSIEDGESFDLTLYDVTGGFTDYIRKKGCPLRFGTRQEYEAIIKSSEGEINPIGTHDKSFLGVPLMLSGTSIGAMVAHDFHTGNAYSAQDEELMVFASEHIARAIESVRAEEKIRKQHQLVLRQKEAITESIHYAQRIQNAALPFPAEMDQILGDYFVFLKPRDVISGDFYWVREVEGIKVIVVADCTGHGVPGALMSMLGITLLNEQFRSTGIIEPGVILGLLRKRVKEILAQEPEKVRVDTVSDQKDGMELSLAMIDRRNNELQFAGAKRPLLLFRKKDSVQADESLLPFQLEGDGEYDLFVLRGDMQPIGVHWEEKAFTSFSVKLQKGDALYMFTDGFEDQYGGRDRKKYKIANLRKLLLSIQPESMNKQRELIEEALNTWMGKHEQIDDICVLGLRI